jgi:GT2 family glycosyltransferase
MPVYNALPYLDVAIESVLAQSHAGFSFEIYDDHSTDGSYERLVEWAARDERISVSRGRQRLGPSASSQAAARLAQTDIVARMDADDIAHPDRLALQFKTLLENVDAVLVGSTFELIDRSGCVIRRAYSYRLSGAAPPMAHASIMYRRAAFEAIGGYRSGTDYYEDQDLCRRVSSQGQVLVFNRPLVQVRFAGQHSRLRDDRLHVLRQIDQQFAIPAEGMGRPSRISPMAFYSMASLATLNLERPHLLGLMAQHGRFDRPLKGGLIAGLILIAEISPRLARWLGHMQAQLRERWSRRRYAEGATYQWHFR